MLYSSNFCHPCAPRALLSIFTPTHTTRYKIDHCSSLPRWHSWLLMYLNEGLFSYLEQSSAGVSPRRDKAKVPMHIKNWLSWWQLVVFQFGIFPCSFLHHVNLHETWFIRDFLMRCLSSNIWITLPGLTEGCLESCSVYSLKQITSVFGLNPRCPGN